MCLLGGNKSTENGLGVKDATEGLVQPVDIFPFANLYHILLIIPSLESRSTGTRQFTLSSAILAWESLFYCDSYGSLWKILKG